MRGSRDPGAACSCALFHNGPQTGADAGETVADDAVRDAELVGGRLVRVPFGRAQPEDGAIELAEPGDLVQDRLGQAVVDHLLLDVDRGRQGLVGRGPGVLAVAPLPADAVRGLEPA